MKSFFLFVVFTAGIVWAHGQTKPTAPATYTVTLGGYKDGNLAAEQFKKLVDSPLVVKDQKGNQYVITRFRINYTFAATYTDSETQQLKSYKDFRASDFYDTPFLPEVWRASIRDNAKKGDEVIINNVIIRLKNGKKMMISEWKGILK